MKGYFFRTVLGLLPILFFFSQAACLGQPGTRHGENHRERGNPGPMSSTEIRTVLERAGGKIVSLPDGSFFLQWFPEDWKSQNSKHLIITLHGSGGHAERMFNLWYRNRANHDYGIIALQYARENGRGNLQFQDSEEIYQNLELVVDHLRKSGLLDGKTALILHGFSRGSARIFELAALDRAEKGMHAFAAFVADSGSSLAENQGRLSPFLQSLPGNAYDGARFWLYTGTGDHGGRTTTGLRRMKRFISEHGGQVDELYLYETDRHGILITGGPRKESKALNALITYINSIRP